MTLDEFFEIGIVVSLGTHVFEAGDIKAFARKYDPQPFHLDEGAASQSVFGRLCASGWHTTAVWMKRNLATPGPKWDGPGPGPVFGPSPGFTNLKWLKPVYAGDTVAFSRTALSHRSMSSRPGWRILNTHADGTRPDGAKVIEFICAVLVQVE